MGVHISMQEDILCVRTQHCLLQAMLALRSQRGGQISIAYALGNLW
jgi:hypothetical protein